LLLHVVDDEQPAGLIEAEWREATRLLQRQAEDLAGAGAPPPRVLVETGDAFDGILRAAEAHASDLVVLGAHHRNLLRDVFVGTTAERVMRHGHPVLMVNRPVAGPYRSILAAAGLDEPSAGAPCAASELGLLRGGLCCKVWSGMRGP
jgi:hypothetical protein